MNGRLSHQAAGQYESAPSKHTASQSQGRSGNNYHSQNKVKQGRGAGIGDVHTGGSGGQRVGNYNSSQGEKRNDYSNGLSTTAERY